MLIFPLFSDKITFSLLNYKDFTMSGVTRELDILKQLFENLSDEDKQSFLTSLSQKDQVKKVIQPRKITFINLLLSV